MKKYAKVKMRNSRGITLVALVVTIIVLIILAGISINLILGDNGIIQKSKQAKELSQEKSAREKLGIELQAMLIHKETGKEYNDGILDNYLTSKGFVVNNDIVLSDGWQFKIDKSVPKIIETLGRGEGIVEEPEQPIIQASGATASPAYLTNGAVTVTLPTQSGYTTEYQIGTLDEDGTWIPYDSTNKVTVLSNTTVFYRYNNGKNSGQYASKTVNNIDTEDPTVSTTLNSSNITTKGFTLNIGVTDTSSGLGKIIWYYKLSTDTNYTSQEEIYTPLNGTTEGETTITKSITVDNLTNGIYSAYAEVYDVAGNSVETSKIDIPLEISEIDLTANVEYATDYTKANIKIGITYEGNITQVKINGEEIQIPAKTDGKYEITKEILQNGNYEIYIEDENGRYKTANVSSTEISEDLTIATVEELVTFRDKVNKGATYEGKTINLISDLDLSSVCGKTIGKSWEPIGYYGANNTLMFKGTFKGNDHIISNLYINETEALTGQGLFGVSSGTIENLTLENANVNGTGTATAILVGVNLEGNIDKITVKGTLDSTGNMTGGITGRNTGTINEAINYAKVDSESSYTGGISGRNEATITQSYNYGDVTAKDNLTGGITGYNTGTINETINHAKVNSESTNTGGISGRNIATITNSHNYGAITGNGNSVGGISGHNSGSILYCSNLEEIIGNGAQKCVGGIVGLNGGTNWEGGTVSECFNTAKVSSNGHQVGGIVGTNSTNAYITNCYNIGEVVGSGCDSGDDGYVGGICGANYGTSTVKSCYNTGNVTGSYPNVGGITGTNGSASSTADTVENVYNAGTIKKGTIAASGNIGTDSSYVGYLIGRYGKLSGKYGNTSVSAIVACTETTIKTNLSTAFTIDKKDDEGNWKYNNGLPILNWQTE